MYYQTKELTPCAFITKDKQRLKQFGQNVYLNNGDEFEIELFNPSQTTVLAKIKINGNYLSGGGLVIKPGQRIFLERHLDDAKKFKFETYEVDGTSNEVLNAITNNGDVVIEFYNETSPKPQIWGGTSITTANPYYNGLTFTTNGLGFGDISNYRSEITCFYNSNYNASSKKSIETGRIEKGRDSDQSFSYVNKQFGYSIISESSWKILPTSNKPYESKDLKVYCVECGTKRKKDSHKFCPHCGTKY